MSDTFPEEAALDPDDLAVAKALEEEIIRVGGQHTRLRGVVMISVFDKELLFSNVHDGSTWGERATRVLRRKIEQMFADIDAAVERAERSGTVGHA